MPRKRNLREYTTNIDKVKDGYGTIAHYCRKKGLNYTVAKQVLHNLGRSANVEKQLERDGFLTYIKTSNEEIV